MSHSDLRELDSGTDGHVVELVTAGLTERNQSFGRAGLIGNHCLPIGLTVFRLECFTKGRTFRDDVCHSDREGGQVGQNRWLHVGCGGGCSNPCDISGCSSVAVGFLTNRNMDRCSRISHDKSRPVFKSPIVSCRGSVGKVAINGMIRRRG